LESKGIFLPNQHSLLDRMKEMEEENKVGRIVFCFVFGTERCTITNYYVPILKEPIIHKHHKIFKTATTS
jgi:hypothetical protein